MARLTPYIPAIKDGALRLYFGNFYFPQTNVPKERPAYTCRSSIIRVPLISKSAVFLLKSDDNQVFTISAASSINI